MRRYVVLDSSTGEVVQDLGNAIEGTTFVPLSENEYVGRKNPVRTVKLKYDYVKFNYKTAILLCEKCPQAFKLIPFIDYHSNILKFANGHYATLRGIATKLGYSKEYFKGELVKKLKNYEIIKICKHNNKRAIFFNPYIACRGKDIEEDTVLMFNNSDWALLGGVKKDEQDYDREN